MGSIRKEFPIFPVKKKKAIKKEVYRIQGMTAYLALYLKRHRENTGTMKVS